MSYEVVDLGGMVVVEGTPVVAGPRGKSAYEVAVANGFVGTEAEWLETLEAETEPHTHPISDVTGLTAALAAKADDSDITALQTEVDGKAGLAHTHDLGDLDDLDPTMAIYLTQEPEDFLGSIGAVSYTELDTNTDFIPMPAVTGLDDALNDKVDDDDARLTDARTPTAHAHPQSDVTGLGAALTGKSDVGHTHLLADITDLDLETEVADAVAAFAPGEIQDQMETWGAGAELAYAERTTNFTTTNITAFSVAAGDIISGLSITVNGTGRPFDLEFTGLVRHSVASTIVGVCLIADGVATGYIGAGFSPSTTVNTTMTWRRRLPALAVGVSKSYTVSVYGSAAGTSTIGASVNIPSQLSAIGR